MYLAQDDPDRDYGKKDRRREEERKRKAARSGFVRDLVQEIEGAPEEVSRTLHPGHRRTAIERHTSTAPVLMMLWGSMQLERAVPFFKCDLFPTLLLGLRSAVWAVLASQCRS